MATNKMLVPILSILCILRMQLTVFAQNSSSNLSPDQATGNVINSTIVSVANTELGQNRSITLRNQVLLRLPIVLSVIAGIRCLENDTRCPYENGLGVGAHDLAALPVAIEDVRKNVDWQYFHDMQITIFDSHGQEMKSIEAVTNATTSVNSMAIIGPQDTCTYEPGIAAMDSRFMLSYRCKATAAGQSSGSSSSQSGSEYSTFARLRPSFGEVARGVVDFMQSYGWDRIVLLHVSDHSQDAFNSVDVLIKLLQASNINVTRTYTIDNAAQNYVPLSRAAKLKYIQILVDTYQDTRAYVILSISPVASETLFFCDIMARMGLIQTGEYVIVVTSATKYDFLYDQTNNTADVWLRYPVSPFEPYGSSLLRRPSPAEVYQYYRSAAFMIESRPVAEQTSWQSFQSRVREVFKKPPCPLLCDYPIQEFPSPYSKGYVAPETGFLYDAIVSYVNATVETIKSNVSDPSNGEIMLQQYGERVIQSVTGLDIYVDSFGVPLGNVSVLTAFAPNRPSKPGLYPVAQFWLNITDNAVGWTLHYKLEGMNWPNGRAPPVRPRCGFKGNKCHSWKDYAIPIILCGLGVLATIAAAAAILAYRQWKYERELQGLFWKVLSQHLKLQDLQEHVTSMRSMGSGTLAGFHSTANLKMQQSLLSLGGYEKNLIREIKRTNVGQKKLPPLKRGGYGVPTQRRKEPDSEEQQRKLWEEVENFAVADYNGQMVALKRVYKPHVEFTRDIRKELKFMIGLKEDNVHGIMGIVHEPLGVYLVSDLRQRGCLKDILENEDIEIDSVFLSSMIGDLVKGLHFIHQSPLKCHGRLKSTNCLVDARWVLRVSGFDMAYLRQGEDKKLGEEGQCRKLLWTAPELLRDPVAMINGTQKGDIYAFGIILHEMYGRKGPFGDELLNPIEVVNNVMHPRPDQPPYRPDMSVLEGLESFVELTMRACWDESPEARPTLEGVKKKLKPILKEFAHTSVVENIITMMEKYSSNLENLVADRTDELQKERKKTERLLLMMLPPSIAESLRRGHNVDPERYESVTMYFSDIAGFTAMSSESTPDQIVTFLNDLYSCFDDIINTYDVYKVETIGDAYMVVSGAPIRNGDNHAGEIASMSLSLLDAVNHFKIRHRPTDMLKLRIGIHSGYAIAGVVGARMPRYCLFGEHVQKTSRMEQMGEALKIHCSSACKALLERLNGYDIVDRGCLEIKPGEEEITYWVVKENLDIRESRIQAESVKYPALKRRR